VLDNISGGRVEIGAGMGYAPHEFRGFGLPVSRRVSLTDEGLDVLKPSPARSSATPASATISRM
jgi:alkanesulfonate monooxygenase SsuD/methylene tetrahydromethanopterin reductase-like flavin-dependent oxidoreductase (luciferase family)